MRCENGSVQEFATELKGTGILEYAGMPRQVSRANEG